MEASVINIEDIEYWEEIENEEVFDLTVEDNHNFYLATNSGQPILVHNSGKSELLLEFLFNMSHFHGWKHLLYVPDIGDSIETMAKLIHKYTGKTFQKRYPNYIDIKTAFNSCAWLLQHFFILEKKDPRASVTPMKFWDLAAEMKQSHGIQTATIDSWKDLRHEYGKFGGSYAMYLSEMLPYRNMVAEQHGLHFHTIIHPKNARRVNGKIQMPDVDDMEGGAQWNNSGKSIISIHRPTYDAKFADIKILKAKPASVGVRGMTVLNFDASISRYYEIKDQNGGERLFAHKEKTPTVNGIIAEEPWNLTT